MRNITILLLIFVISACKNESDEFNAATDLIGEWELTAELSIENEKRDIETTNDWQTWEFKNNDELTISHQGGVETYQWEFKQDNITDDDADKLVNDVEQFRNVLTRTLKI